MNKGFYNFRGGNNFRNGPIDRRRLNKKDRSDYSQGGKFAERQRALARVRAYNGQNRILANRDQPTTTQTPGSGGQSAGLGIQQQRYRDIGQEQDAQVQSRPEMDNSMYDIYKTD